MAIATISVLGVDLGKNVCSVVGLNSSGAVVMRRKMRRETVIGLAEKLPPCVVAMEALRRPSPRPAVRRPRSRRPADVARIRPPLCQGAQERRSRRRGHRGGRDAADDAVRRTEEPGSARHADASPISRPSGRRADGSDQSAARHSAGARLRRSAGQAEVRTVPGRIDGRTGRNWIEPANDLARRRRSRAMGGTRSTDRGLRRRIRPLSRKRTKTPADWRPSPGSARSSPLALCRRGRASGEL